VPSVGAVTLTQLDGTRIGDAWGRSAAYDAYSDGLHSYALAALRDHEAAVDALYTTFVVADRNIGQLRDADLLQPWLYALCRHECRLRVRAGGGPVVISDELRANAPSDPALRSLEANLRRAELSSLDWPEADGIAPACREVLELTIRHGLDSRSISLVLGSVEHAAFDLLASAWRELERALALGALSRGPRRHCARFEQLTSGWPELDAERRAEAGTHVDTCSQCQHELYAVLGAPAAPSMLPFVAPPRFLRDQLLADLARGRCRALADGFTDLLERAPTFDERGFPVAVDRGAGADDEPARGRRQRGRRHAESTGAVAGAAADLATAGGADAARDAARPSTIAAIRAELGDDTAPTERLDAVPSELVPGMRRRERPRPEFESRPGSDVPPWMRPGADAGSDGDDDRPVPRRSRGRRATRLGRGRRTRVLSGVAVVSALGVAGTVGYLLLGSSPDHGQGGTATGDLSPTDPRDGSPQPIGSMAVTLDSPSSRAASSPVGPPPATSPLVAGTSAAAGAGVASAVSPGTGTLNVAADQRSALPWSVTVRLWNSGSAPVSWTATPDVGYVSLSQRSGTLQPGQQQAVVITVNPAQAPPNWVAHVRFDPSGAVVVLRAGNGGSTPPGTPSPTPTPSRTPTPPPTQSPTPSQSPSSSTPPTTTPSVVTPTTNPPSSTVPPSPGTPSASTTPPASTPPASPSASGGPTAG
jgi:DNA-directed RNA polymerase specialized sigma24 family protein